MGLFHWNHFPCYLPGPPNETHGYKVAPVQLLLMCKSMENKLKKGSMRTKLLSGCVEISVEKWKRLKKKERVKDGSAGASGESIRSGASGRVGAVAVSSRVCPYRGSCDNSYDVRHNMHLTCTIVRLFLRKSHVSMSTSSAISVHLPVSSSPFPHDDVTLSADPLQILGLQVWVESTFWPLSQILETHNATI